jgi:hypothetical protein
MEKKPTAGTKAKRKAGGNRRRGARVFSGPVVVAGVVSERPAFRGPDVGEMIFSWFYREADAADPAAQMAYCKGQMAGVECRA